MGLKVKEGKRGRNSRETERWAKIAKDTGQMKWQEKEVVKGKIRKRS